MSTQRGWDRGMPWIYGAVAIGGTVAALAAIVIIASLLRSAWLAGGPPYQWFPFFWFFPFVGFLVVIFLLKWCFWGWGWRSSCWRPYAGLELFDERVVRIEARFDQTPTGA